MKTLTIDGFFINISKDDIHYFETKYKIELPEYLKDFILKYNGTSTNECVFTTNTNYIVNSFLPLLENRNASVELMIPIIRSEEEGFGRFDLIPFATDPGGRPFLVSIGREDEGTVYYSIIGFGENEPLRKIAYSFEEFINGLKTEDEV